MEPCTYADIQASYTECDPSDNMRLVEYAWIEPKICDDKAKNAV